MARPVQGLAAASQIFLCSASTLPLRSPFFFHVPLTLFQLDQPNRSKNKIIQNNKVLSCCKAKRVTHHKVEGACCSQSRPCTQFFVFPFQLPSSHFHRSPLCPPCPTSTCSSHLCLFVLCWESKAGMAWYLLDRVCVHKWTDRKANGRLIANCIQSCVRPDISCWPWRRVDLFPQWRILHSKGTGTVIFNVFVYLAYGVFPIGKKPSKPPPLSMVHVVSLPRTFVRSEGVQ